MLKTVRLGLHINSFFEIILKKQVVFNQIMQFSQFLCNFPVRVGNNEASDISKTFLDTCISTDFNDFYEYL